MSMVEIKIDTTKCNVCGTCVDICPVEVLEIRDKRLVVVNIDASVSWLLSASCLLPFPSWTHDTLRPSTRNVLCLSYPLRSNTPRFKIALVRSSARSCVGSLGSRVKLLF